MGTVFEPKMGIPDHWTQKFPVHQTVRVRHEYKPAVGFQGFKASKIGSELKNACIDLSLQKKLGAAADAGLKSGVRMPATTT